MALLRLDKHPDMSSTFPGFIYFNTTEEVIYEYTGNQDKPWKKVPNLSVEDVESLIKETPHDATVSTDDITISINEKKQVSLGKVVGEFTEVNPVKPLKISKDVTFSNKVNLTTANLKTVNGATLIGTGDIKVLTAMPETKTINGQSLVGSGDIVVLTKAPDIKTVQGKSLSGTGNIDIEFGEEGFTIVDKTSKKKATITLVDGAFVITPSA